MKAPDKIYIRETNEGFSETWYQEKRLRSSILATHSYIRKDALLEWASRLKEKWEEPPISRHSPGCVFMLEQLINKLNSM